jgi:hypothetical protein
MRYDNRRQIESEIKTLLERHKEEPRTLIANLVDLVRQAFEAGEEEGKRREARRDGIG